MRFYRENVVGLKRKSWNGPEVVKPKTEIQLCKKNPQKKKISKNYKTKNKKEIMK